MPVIGITGGIASGKTTLMSALTSVLPAKFFNADEYGNKLLLEDPTVAQAFKKVFGPDIIDPKTGKLTSSKIQEVMFRSVEDQIKLGEIIHDPISQRWQQWVQEEQQKDPKALLCVEVPLLFELQLDREVDKIILMASDPQIQLQRLIERRGYSEEVGRHLIKSQLELELKLRFCDYVIWNNSNHTTYHVKKQIELCVNLLKATFLKH